MSVDGASVAGRAPAGSIATGAADVRHDALEPRVLVPLRIVGEPPALGQPVHALSGETMGTTWSVRFVGPAGLRTGAIEDAIVHACDEVIAQMSGWIGDSDLSRFNRAAAGTSQPLPEAFASVVTAALRVAADSGGAYDPTAGALVALWGFGPSGPTAIAPRHDAADFRAPSPEACARAHCGWATLDWDEGQRRLTQPGGATLDLSAIAKGFAVDRVSALLRSLGLPDHLVEIGGELRGAGLKPEGQPWWVEIEPPAADCGLAPLRVALHGLSVATSGDYRKCFADADGRRRSHTVDPRTRRPVEHGLTSVTVVHEDAMWADGWSTALMVLGPDEGLALADRLGLAARLVRRVEVGDAARRFHDGDRDRSQDQARAQAQAQAQARSRDQDPHPHPHPHPHLDPHQDQDNDGSFDTGRATVARADGRPVCYEERFSVAMRELML